MPLSPSYYRLLRSLCSPAGIGHKVTKGKGQVRHTEVNYVYHARHPDGPEPRKKTALFHVDRCGSDEGVVTTAN